MATLDSPLEALAFEYASFGVLAVLNNVWTWIAVVTAALSFWRIRVTSMGEEGSKYEQKTTHIDECKPEAKTYLVEETTSQVEEMVRETEVMWPLICEDGVTKGKLKMYYEVDVDGGNCVDGELTVVNYGESLGNCREEWWERLDKVVRMRNGNDGWYRYVDLKVINGNVVRLWDDKRNHL